MIFQTAYFQMCGRNKSRNQDALFNSAEAKHAKMNKSRIVEVSGSPIRVAVADGVYSSEQPHLASRFWVNAWADNGACERAFFTRNFGRFCDTNLVAKLEELHRAVKLGEFYDDCSVVCVQAA